MTNKEVNGKFGIWLSNLELNAIQKALRWYDNCAINFKDDSKTAIMRLLIDDLHKIQSNGPQIKRQSENCKVVYENEIMEKICEECE
tara:strand:+ start:464 stop:724 length:261 start_codon:yes stop_codon:yes gene_type:complete